MKKVISAILIIAVVAVAGIWYFIFYRPTHYKRDITVEKYIGINAADIVKEFQNNEDSANKKYLNKIIQVTGIVGDVKKNQNGKMVLTLNGADNMSNVICTLQNNNTTATTGATVTLKGICTGYLMDVVIIDAIIIDSK
ncbi:OB-fold putative lipoprotein [Ferruginibacter lapsinanis]|uniref:OB-fold putative lipoprotein n=1 Tax=Ferruginibacter lapsinanis TaxID=563172 RepID=UPI001E50A238|nr:OB-fold putative lipoprotein [Ferruginibacter lapsinanis]UEG51290.1 OB-fold putative lipoprotein [Ferruginibacter lapsinanis]